MVRVFGVRRQALAHSRQPLPALQCEFSIMPANKITGPNAGGLRQFPIRTPVGARVGQFCRSALRAGGVILWPQSLGADHLAKLATHGRSQAPLAEGAL
jgi:hypothetical protein